MDADELRSRRVGEVVGTASTSFVAQCYVLYVCPPLAASSGLIPPRCSEWFPGSVPSHWTQPSRTGQGRSRLHEDEVFRNNPQLSRLLTTRFEAIITGHMADGTSNSSCLLCLPPSIPSFIFAPLKKYAGSPTGLTSFHC